MHEHEELDREATPSEAEQIAELERRYRRLKEGATADDLDDSPPECDSKSSSKSSEAAEVLNPHAAACSYWMPIRLRMQRSASPYRQMTAVAHRRPNATECYSQRYRMLRNVTECYTLTARTRRSAPTNNDLQERMLQNVTKCYGMLQFRKMSPSPSHTLHAYRLANRLPSDT